MKTIRVIVVDDQSIVREGLVTVLGLFDDIDVVGDAGDGAEAVRLVGELRPDVVLMDLRMPVLTGAEATAAILGAHPDTAVLVLTTYKDDESIAAALAAGARGYLTKDAGREDIAAAIRAVVRGQSTFDAEVTRKIVAGLRPAADGTGEGARGPGDPPSSAAGRAAEATPPAGLGELTAREREVLDLIGEGLSNAEIAARLFVSNATVKTHINNLFAKLGLRDRAQAVRLAITGDS